MLIPRSLVQVQVGEPKYQWSFLGMYRKHGFQIVVGSTALPNYRVSVIAFDFEKRQILVLDNQVFWFAGLLFSGSTGLCDQATPAANFIIHKWLELLYFVAYRFGSNLC